MDVGVGVWRAQWTSRGADKYKLPDSYIQSAVIVMDALNSIAVSALCVAIVIL